LCHRCGLRASPASSAAIVSVGECVTDNAMPPVFRARGWLLLLAMTVLTPSGASDDVQGEDRSPLVATPNPV
jgi:hypothetical protein